MGRSSASNAREIDVPQPAEGDVIVRVHSAGLHIGDVFAVRGSPFLVRMATGLGRPRYGVPGFDLAGTVAAVGSGVTRFAAGDEVFGTGRGTAAEFSRAREDELVAKPAGLPFDQAAAIPTSALAALHGLRDAGRLQAGRGPDQRRLRRRRHLRRPDREGLRRGRHRRGQHGHLELCSLGADDVIDYTREDFTTRAATWDLSSTTSRTGRCPEVRRALKPDGTLVLNSGTGARGLGMLVRLAAPIVLSPFTRQSLRRFISNPNQADLVVLRDMVEAGTLRPVVDRTFRLDEAVAALQHIAGGHARGKVVLVT